MSFYIYDLPSNPNYGVSILKNVLTNRQSSVVASNSYTGSNVFNMFSDLTGTSSLSGGQICVRQLLDSTHLGSGFGGNQIQVTLTWGGSGTSPVDRTYIGRQLSSGSHSFDGNQVPVTWNGGQASPGNATTGANVVSDVITLPQTWNPSANYIFAYDINSNYGVTANNTASDISPMKFWYTSTYTAPNFANNTDFAATPTDAGTFITMISGIQRMVSVVNLTKQARAIRTANIAVGWDPKQLPNLVGLYRADQGVSNGAGSAITRWLDQSGQGQTLANGAAAATTAPHWSATGFNGKPGVVFTGATEQFLENTAFQFSNDTFTIFALVGNTTSDVDSTGPFSTYGSFLDCLASGGTDAVQPSFEIILGANNGVSVNSQITYYSSGGIFSGQNQGIIDSGTAVASPLLFGISQNGQTTHNYQIEANNTILKPFGTGTGTNGVLAGGSPNSLIMGIDQAGEAVTQFIGNVAFWGITQGYVLTADDWNNLARWANETWGTTFPTNLNQATQGLIETGVKSSPSGNTFTQNNVFHATGTFLLTKVVDPIRSFTANATSQIIKQAGAIRNASATATDKITKSVGRTIGTFNANAGLVPLWQVGKTWKASATATANQTKSVGTIRNAASGVAAQYSRVLSAGRSFVASVSATSQILKRVNVTRLTAITLTALATAIRGAHQYTQNNIFNVTVTNRILKSIGVTRAEAITTASQIIKSIGRTIGTFNANASLAPLWQVGKLYSSTITTTAKNAKSIGAIRVSIANVTISAITKAITRGVLLFNTTVTSPSFFAGKAFLRLFTGSTSATSQIIKSVGPIRVAGATATGLYNRTATIARSFINGITATIQAQKSVNKFVGLFHATATFLTPNMIKAKSVFTNSVVGTTVKMGAKSVGFILISTASTAVNITKAVTKAALISQVGKLFTATKSVAKSRTATASAVLKMGTKQVIKELDAAINNTSTILKQATKRTISQVGMLVTIAKSRPVMQLAQVSLQSFFNRVLPYTRDIVFNITSTVTNQNFIPKMFTFVSGFITSVKGLKEGTNNPILNFHVTATSSLSSIYHAFLMPISVAVARIVPEVQGKMAQSVAAMSTTVQSIVAITKPKVNAVPNAISIAVKTMMDTIKAKIR